MLSTAYVWLTNEQARFNALILEKTRDRLPPPTFPKMALLTGLAVPRFRYITRPEYLSARCPKCGIYDTDDMIALGFDFDYLYDLRSKEDAFDTADRFCVLHERARSALVEAGVEGFTTKSVRGTPYHVLQITRRIDLITKVFRACGRTCKTCGRKPDGGGMIQGRSAFAELPDGLSLFTSTQRFVSRSGSDHDILCTPGVIEVLRAKSICCGAFHRLWTDEEAATHRAKAHQGEVWYPSNRTIYLNRRTTG